MGPGPGPRRGGARGRGRGPWRAAWTAGVGVALVGAALAAGEASDDFRFFDPLIDVKGVISRFAFDPPDDEALQIAAIEGMLEALDDPYATYVPPQFNEEFNKQLTGEYVGIGAEVQMGEGYLRIVTPLDDSPAFHAGVLAEDRVVAINGERTAGLTVDECIDRLQGEPGTPVELSVERGAAGSAEALTITVLREEIRTRAVRGFHRADDGSWRYDIDPARRIGYVRLSQFTPAVAAEFDAAMAALAAEEGRLAGLIIDLRWNPGGLLDQAVDLSDRLLESGVIVSTRGRDAADETVQRAEEPGTLPDFPIAVLVNGQSASASEVLAGALSENGRAVVIGERTFGKGSVQTVRSLSGAGAGAAIKLTEQRYFLPSGRSIQRTDDSAAWGVDPTAGFYVPLRDEQVRDLMLARRGEDIIGGAAKADRGEGRWADPDWIVEHLKDPQLAAAVRAVQQRVDSGEWQPVGEAQGDYDPAALGELRRAEASRERVYRELERLERRIAALESGLGEAAASADDPIDLIPDEAELDGGTLTVTDASGATVATLRIRGQTLERWLIDAGVEKLAPEAPAAGDATPATPAPAARREPTR